MPEWKELYAHSANANGDRQLLIEHLRNVSTLARDFGQHFGAGDIGYLAGLWHDAGKADPEWQRRLIESEQGSRGGPIGIDHKLAGVLLARNQGAAFGIVGPVIHGHHGGIRNPRTELGPWIDEKSKLSGPKDALESIAAVMPDLRGQEQPAIPEGVRTNALNAELFIRFTYSALVDADSLDTEAHRLGGPPEVRGNPVTLTELWARFQRFVANQPDSPPSDVTNVRRAVFEDCLAASSKPQGIFRLTVPTGGGKTRSGMAFALRHAIEHDLRRIIVAVPFTTITQQTASVYRDIFGDDHAVLEHHSAAVEGQGPAPEDDDSYDDSSLWQRLAADNWDAPIVVTTTVQLFESLFSNRRGKTRKLHNLSRSVIILDEAQALPAHLLSPILDAVAQLARNYGCSVVLSTATQPAFESIQEFRDIQAQEMVSDYRSHFDLLRRVEYEWLNKSPQAWKNVADLMRTERSVLTIVNTKRHAIELLDELADPETLHLSTLLCGAHRNEVLQDVRRRLAAGIPCRVVSTQVVEAGVDLDFETVFRAEAPLDAIIQAAGRCNREGFRERGRVMVFRPPDDAIPGGSYKTGRDVARVVSNLPGFDPSSVSTINTYFERLFESGVDSDRNNIQSLRSALDFPAVAEKFRMIEDDSYDVIVRYPFSDTGRIDDLIEDLLGRRRSPRNVLRELQPHTVSIRHGQSEFLRSTGLIEDVEGMRGLGIWHGGYDDVRGLVASDPELII